MRLVIKAWRKLEDVVSQDFSIFRQGPLVLVPGEKERERERHVEHSLIAANFVNYRRTRGGPY